ncbi:hypothetical protein Theba_0126 [Mesotoga prima MesG1.Ag.4.2]|uniref:Uncharacterized protein n=1 Tax=Mesotoga prima MesG1.Ag.4.2 TaxID=660470 RepID=I2F1S0_9BACT|nr:hypothetical protein Theba_0126 [Mesotoga prima MesG1.Ag.4.2]
MLNCIQITGCNTFLGPEAVILTMLLVRIPVSREKWDLGNCQSRFSLTAISVSRQVSSALRTEMLKQVQMIEYGVGMSNQRLQPFLSSCHSEMILLRISLFS